MRSKDWVGKHGTSLLLDQNVLPVQERQDIEIVVETYCYLF